MAGKKDSFVLYYELEEQIEHFSDEEVGALLRAILAYEKRGDKPDDLSAVVAVAFSFIAPQLDRNREKYNKIIESRRKAGRKGGENSAAARNANNTDAEQNKQMLENQADYVPVHDPGCDPGCVPGCVPGCEPESEGTSAPSSITQTLHKHGTYGWVALTDEQYSRLAIDLGQAELERCITHIDESAQSTNNKNGWEDWDVVLRRCHRDGWGLSQTQRGDAKNVQQSTQPRDASYYTVGFHATDS